MGYARKCDCCYNGTKYAQRVLASVSYFARVLHDFPSHCMHAMKTLFQKPSMNLSNREGANRVLPYTLGELLALAYTAPYLFPEENGL